MNDRESHPHELVSAMHDGEIDDRERALVDAHLRECAACRDLARDLATLGEVLAEDPVPPVPAGLASRIGWSLRSRDASRRRLGGVRWSGPRMLAAAGGVAAAGLLAVVFLHERSAYFSPYSDHLDLAAKETAAARVPGAGGTGPGAAGTDTSAAATDMPMEGGALQGSGPGDGTARKGRERLQPGLSGGGAAAKPDGFGYGTFAPAPPGPAPAERGAAAAPPAAPSLPPPPSRQEGARSDDLKSDAGLSPTQSGREAYEHPKEALKKKTAAHDVPPPVPLEEEKREASNRVYPDSVVGGTVGGVVGGVLGGDKDAGVDKEADAASTAAPKALPDPRTARSKPNPLAKTETKAIVEGTIVIPRCPGRGGEKAARRWSPASAPLPLRAARQDAEPDLAALAARLGGSICTAAGSATMRDENRADFVLDVPVGRWSELRDALSARTASPPTLGAPPAEGYDIVRVILHPR